MSHGCANVLLLGVRAGGSSYLRRQLKQHGFKCWFARSPDQGLALFDRHAFHLLLSARFLHEGNLLIALSAESNWNAFCCYPVEEGFRRLPLVRHGQKCSGAPALRPSELLDALDQIVRDSDSGLIPTASQPQEVES